MSFLKLCVVVCLAMLFASCNKSDVSPNNIVGEKCSIHGTVVDILELTGSYIIKTDDSILIRPVVDRTRPCPIMTSLEVEEGMRIQFSYRDLGYILDGSSEGATDALAINLLCLVEEGDEIDDGHK